MESVIEEGLEQIERSDASLLLSATAAGLILGFTAMAVGSMGTILSGWENSGLTRLGMAVVYPLGFVVVILSGTQLFTEHTATAIYPVLDGRAGFKQPFRLWFFVLLGNLIGGSVFVAVLNYAHIRKTQSI